MSIYPASVWLDEVWDTLERYNNQWVAAVPGEVVANNENLDIVLRLLSEIEINRERIVIAFITQDVQQ